VRHIPAVDLPDDPLKAREEIILQRFATGERLPGDVGVGGDVALEPTGKVDRAAGLGNALDAPQPFQSILLPAGQSSTKPGGRHAGESSGAVEFADNPVVLVLIESRGGERIVLQDGLTAIGSPVGFDGGRRISSSEGTEDGRARPPEPGRRRRGRTVNCRRLR